MARKQTRKATEEIPEIEAVIGKYVDPTEESSILAMGDKVIINSTQVSRANIDGLMQELQPLGVAVIEVVSHPSEYTEEV